MVHLLHSRANVDTLLFTEVHHLHSSLLSVVHSMGSDKGIMSDIRYSIIQNSFNAVKLPGAPSAHPSPFLTSSIFKNQNAISSVKNEDGSNYPIIMNLYDACVAFFFSYLLWLLCSTWCYTHCSSFTRLCLHEGEDVVWICPDNTQPGPCS